MTAFAVRVQLEEPLASSPPWLSTGVLAAATSLLLLLGLAFTPQNAWQRFQAGPRWPWWLASAGLLVALAWVGFQISDAFLACAHYALAPIVATTLVSRATGDLRLLASSSMMLALAVFVFGIQAFSGGHGDPITARWGDRHTFALMFPKEPPFTGPGGRLRPNLDLYMNAKDQPQGARLRTNSLGFRNVHELAPEPPAHRPRILNLGDSFSIGMEIDQRDFFGAVLERELQRSHGEVEVVNAEISDPAYGLIYFQEYGHELGAQVVVLGLCANDIMQVDDSVGLPGERLFFLDSDGWLRPNVEPAPYENHVRRYEHLANPEPAWGVQGEAAPGSSPSLQVSKRILSRALRLRALDWAFSKLPRRQEPVLMYSYAAEIEASDGRKRYFDGMTNLGAFLEEPPPEVALLQAKLFAVLDALDRQVRADGAQLVLVLYPQRFQVHPEDWELLVTSWKLEAEAYDLDLPNRQLVAWCAARGIACCDLLPAYRQAAREPLYIRNGDMHPNVRGHRIAGEVVAAAVGELLDAR